MVVVETAECRKRVWQRQTRQTVKCRYREQSRDGREGGRGKGERQWNAGAESSQEMVVVV